ncbi:hypothetical protein BKP54_21330 [Ensifer sp. 1H6]|nr:hypothetical protein BKP54_21330 [Ensifer sp. 1H6]
MTVANNGIYRKIGTSGVGSWPRVADLPYSFIIASNAGAGAADAIQATTSVPVSKSALIWASIAEANTESPVTISFNGGAPMTIETNSGSNIAVGGFVAGMIVMGIVSGTIFRLISDQTSEALLAQVEAVVDGIEVGAFATADQGEKADWLPPPLTSLKGQVLAVRSDGSGYEPTGTPTGQFFAEDGARIVRQAERVFIGDAVENLGTNTGSQPDWLTQYLLSKGRTFAFQQVTQQAVLTTDDDYSANAFLAGGRTSTLGIPGNAIGVLGLAVNDNTTLQTGAYGGYFEGFQNTGALGPAYGTEVDIINFDDPIAIDPFTQNAKQTIGQQMASGAEFAGAESASAAYNIRNNGANFLRGIVVGNDAIAGTDGTTGRGAWALVATGHTEQTYSASGLMAWERGAEPGLNGDYFIESQGTGSVKVKRLKETDGNAWDSYTPSATPASGTFTTATATGRYRVRGKSVEFSASLSITTNGTAAGGINISLPFQAAAGVGYALAADERAASGVLCRASVAASGLTAQVFRYDNTYPGGNGAVIVISGVYQRV